MNEPNPTPKPPNWDWVTARADCSIDRLFADLTNVITADTEKANGRAEKRGIRFRIETPVGRGVVVVRQRDAGGVIEEIAIAFEQTLQGAIRVLKRDRSDSIDMFEARPVLDAHGNCKFEVGKDLLDPWQVSRRALENLFFGFGL